MCRLSTKICTAWSEHNWLIYRRGIAKMSNQSVRKVLRSIHTSCKTWPFLSHIFRMFISVIFFRFFLLPIFCFASTRLILLWSKTKGKPFFHFKRKKTVHFYFEYFVLLKKKHFFAVFHFAIFCKNKKETYFFHFKRNNLLLFCIAICKFLSNHARYTGDRKTRRKRNMGCCVLLSVVSSPPPPPPCAPFHLPAAMLAGLEGQGRASPPLHTPTPLDNFEAAVADLEDGL